MKKRRIRVSGASKKQFDELQKSLEPYPEYVSPMMRKERQIKGYNLGSDLQTFEQFLEEHHLVEDQVRLIKYLLKRFGLKLKNVKISKS